MSTLLEVGNCVEVLADYPDCILDAVVTDPPYDLKFMGQKWDGTGIAFDPDTWRAVLRVMKPGAYLLAFGGTRTYHRMVCAIEDAGFEVRDSLHWIYGTGFPKSLNLGDGRGTALKPGHEPIVLARRPCEGTTTANVETWGTGGLNVDACRIAYQGDADLASATPQGRCTVKAGAIGATPDAGRGLKRVDSTRNPQTGRFPSNVLLDDDAATELDAQSGVLSAGHHPHTRGEGGISTGGHGGQRDLPETTTGKGGASRFFYCAKASRSEREAGCEALDFKSAGVTTGGRAEASAGLNSPRAGAGRTSGARNYHPTVKPVALMRWLVRLVTPPNGTVCDPFVGSGSTGIAARLEGRSFLGIDQSADYINIAEARIEAA